jgi:hypothetical protein
VTVLLALCRVNDQLRKHVSENGGIVEAPIAESQEIRPISPGTAIAVRARMSSLAAIFVVVSSVGLSVGISRLAVGEMFRLVRSDAKRRKR